jgi:hypothetical protein
MNFKLSSKVLLITSFVFSIGGLVNLNFYLSKTQLDKELLDRYRNIVSALLVINVLMLIPLISQDPNISFYSYCINFILLITVIPSLVFSNGLNTIVDSYRESSVFIIMPFLCLLGIFIVYLVEMKTKKLTESSTSSSTERSSSGYSSSYQSMS